MADFAATELASRDAEIDCLKGKVADLERLIEQKTAVDLQVAEIAKRLDAQASASDEAKRGPKGMRGVNVAREASADRPEREDRLVGAPSPRPRFTAGTSTPQSIGSHRF